MFLSDSTKYDIVVILVFFSELFDGYPIRGLMRKVFYSFLVGTAFYIYVREGMPEYGVKLECWGRALINCYMHV